MEIAVIGAGNMGCVYGGNLARVGERVTLVDVWAEHVARIQADGLQLTGLHGDFTVHVDEVTDPSAAAKCDVALICTNAYSTRDAAASARLLLKEPGYALTLQNGVGNVEVLAEALGEKRVLAGLSFHSGDMEAPGRVRHTNQGPTYLGELERSCTPRLVALRELFDRAGLDPVLEDDIVTTIWSKFVHNCGINAICAITGLRPGQIKNIPELDEFQTRIIKETLALLQAKGVQLPDPHPLETIKAYCAKKFHRVSMLQHLERGRQTEIDALNGYVARESLRLGLPAPCSEALTMLMKGRECRPFQETGGDL
jgi:2-dehydropantoate 2-reductase